MDLFGMEKALQSALYRGIDFLYQNQLPTGEFKTFLSNNPMMEGHCVYDSSPFATTIVLHGLRHVRDRGVEAYVEKIRKSAYAFFLAEMEPPGLWRYWTSRSGKSIAPDLDDICCISFLLKEAGFGATYFNNREIVRKNRTKNGLFCTWIQDDVERNDIDSVVNANVLLYLGQCPETEALCQHLVQIIEEDLEEKTYWYYLNNLSLYYAISRAYQQGATLLTPAIQRIVEKIKAGAAAGEYDTDAISTSLLVSTLINLGCWEEDLFRKAATNLLATQNKDGSWRRIPYYVGPEPPVPHRAWFGSEELTTGLCVEALARLLV